MPVVFISAPPHASETPQVNWNKVIKAALKEMNGISRYIPHNINKIVTENKSHGKDSVIQMK